MDETLEIKNFAEFVRVRPDTHVGAVHKQAGLRAVAGWEADVDAVVTAAATFAYTSISASETEKLLGEQHVVHKAVKASAKAAATPPEEEGAEAAAKPAKHRKP